MPYGEFKLLTTVYKVKEYMSTYCRSFQAVAINIATVLMCLSLIRNTQTQTGEETNFVLSG
jgi:hypothetical protein